MVMQRKKKVAPVEKGPPRQKCHFQWQGLVPPGIEHIAFGYRTENWPKKKQDNFFRTLYIVFFSNHHLSVYQCFIPLFFLFSFFFYINIYPFSLSFYISLSLSLSLLSLSSCLLQSSHPCCQKNLCSQFAPRFANATIEAPKSSGYRNGDFIIICNHLSVKMGSSSSSSWLNFAATQRRKGFSDCSSAAAAAVKNLRSAAAAVKILRSSSSW